MKIRIVKPVGENLIPHPKAPFAPIPKDGVRVEFPGPDGYWARRAAENVVTVEEDSALPAAEPKSKKSREV